MKRLLLTSTMIAAFAASVVSMPSSVNANELNEPKVVIITFDGVRWEEVFRGADPVLAADERYTEADMKSDLLEPAYLTPQYRPAALMPFMHQVVAKQGVLIGNRDVGQCARVANDMWFSYPGYNEILTGNPDPSIIENDDKQNENVSFLEYLNHIQDFKGKVEMIGTWTLFPKIVNAQRSAVPVNADFNDRFPTDVMTARYGLQALDERHPRVLYIAFGDTDELAHAGDYDQYLQAIERGDDFVRQVWEKLQSDPFYRDQTTLFVSTDHGRGNDPVSAWRDHAAVRYFKLNPTYQPEYNETGVMGSGNVWFAAMGPTVQPNMPSAYTDGNCAETRQIAASVLTALKMDWKGYKTDIGTQFNFIKAPQ